jgi:RNA polymerase sigma factor (sigma-70 family)
MDLNSPLLPALDPSDAELVALGRTGDREAFGRIVGRYQSLICAIAYSACGNLAQSEDIAQEVFLSAWQQLGRLREPERLKSWLCGITRQTAVQFYRRDRREPAQRASELPADAAAPEPLPSEQAFRADEQSILWRAMAQLDPTFREVLVLYYREHRSVEHVAAALDLSEEAVRQRLSRGRKALQEQVLGVLEGTLAASAPGPAFTAGVMGALPSLASASGAAVSALKGGAALKGGIAGSAGLGVLLAPVVGPLAGMFSQLYAAESKKERQWLFRNWAIILIGTALYVAALSTLKFTWTGSKDGFTAILGGVTVLYMLWLGWFCARWGKRWKDQFGEANCSGPGMPSFEYRSPRMLAGLPLVHLRFGTDSAGRPASAKGWIALGHRAYGVIFAGGIFALAPISMGVVSVGLITLGSIAIGGYAFGALALGCYAMGGIAAGYLAFGGFAFGWRAAAGGAAWAHSLAMGGAAVAAQANTPAAEAALNRIFIFRHARAIFSVSVVCSWLPAVVTSFGRRWFRARKRARENAR